MCWILSKAFYVFLRGFRWFEWPGCVRRIPKFSSGSMKLVGIDMRQASVTVVPQKFKDFQRLKYINFSFCKSLIRIPDLSCTPHLEELVLSYCENMVEAHESIAYLEKLQVLDLNGCSRLRVFPNVLKTKRLRCLHLRDCKNLERFPDIPHKLESLIVLSLKGTAIKELPSSIENLVSLKILNLSVCKDLLSLPSSIYKLHNIEELELSGCISFIRFPKYNDSADPSMKIGLSSLKFLDLAESSLTELEFLENHSCCPKLSNLVLLATKITSVATSILKREHLKFLVLSSQIPHPYSYTKIDPYCSDYREFVEMVLQFPSSQGYYGSFLRAELPAWVLPIEKGFVSFRASKDLCHKFLGFILCVFHSTDEKDHGSQSYYVEFEINGQMLRKLVLTPHGNHELDVAFTPFELLLGAVDFVQIYESHVQFSVKVSGGIAKKCGFRIICEPVEEDLKVKLQDLTDPALLYEFSHQST